MPLANELSPWCLFTQTCRENIYVTGLQSCNSSIWGAMVGTRLFQWVQKPCLNELCCGTVGRMEGNKNTKLEKLTYLHEDQSREQSYAEGCHHIQIHTFLVDTYV